MCIKGNIMNFFQGYTHSRKVLINSFWNNWQIFFRVAIFNEKIKEHGIELQTGVFGADMKVSLINDGPVTIILDSQEICK